MHTIDGNYRGPKYKIKKSVFIPSVYKVNSREEVEKRLNEVSKEFRKASHNAWAYRIQEGDAILSDYSDDGEVKGTAGRVMATHIDNLLNVLVIVTRFYGGINLGKGGLIRSYSKVVEEFINNLPKVKLHD